MSEQEKKKQQIYGLLNAETKPKNVQNIWSFFMGPHQAHALTPLIRLYGEC